MQRLEKRDPVRGSGVPRHVVTRWYRAPELILLQDTALHGTRVFARTTIPKQSTCGL